MDTMTNVQAAVEFLTWLFGENPNGYIYILRSRPDPDPNEARQGKFIPNPAAYTKPEKVNSNWWQENSSFHSMVFSTATLKNKNENNVSKNTKEIPALWFDIDACRDLGLDGTEFFTDLTGTEDVSAWVRSSANGIQGYFKLNVPIEINGNKEQFSQEFSGLLTDIAYYFGGDLKVCNLGRLMRLPGSLNIKAQYKTHYLANARLTDNLFSLEELKEKFKPNPNLVPKIILFTINKNLSTIWEPGSRHEIMLRLAGTARKNGLDKASCKTLFKKVAKFFNDEEDRTSEVDSTYSCELDNVQSLRTDYAAIADSIEEAIKFWVDLKTKYCRKRGFDFIPENVNPLQPQNDVFFERAGSTWYNGGDAPEEFSNFVIKLLGKLRKANSEQEVWTAEIQTKDTPPAFIEIPTSKHYNFQQFSNLPNLPPGIAVPQPRYWPMYIAWLAEHCPKDIVIETSYYGFLNMDKAEPSLLLPQIPHEKYLWVGNNEDTAENTIYTISLTQKQIKEYLETFVKYYVDYHEPRYIWSALGWFSSCPISAFLRSKIEGFPTIMICGLAGSGKSQLIKEVLGKHFGAKTTNSFGSTTNFSVRRHLTSNNICPFILDEYRQTHDTRCVELQSTIRSLWDSSQTSAGTVTGEIRKEQYVAPLCVIGEHSYEDEATLHRTFTIRINRSWVQNVQEFSLDEKERFNEITAWLHNSKWKGYLGNIIIHWLQQNIEQIPILIDKATRIVESTSSVKVERKQKGFIAVMAGLLLFKAICKEHEVIFPFKNSELVSFLYEADTNINNYLTYDATTLKTLFKITDAIIVDAVKNRVSLRNVVLSFDDYEPHIMYFDMNRWHEAISKHIKSTSSASISNSYAFSELIKDCAQNGGTPILGFMEGHEIFPTNCVKINYKMIQDMFSVNTNRWSIDGSENDG